MPRGETRSGCPVFWSFQRFGGPSRESGLNQQDEDSWSGYRYRYIRESVVVPSGESERARASLEQMRDSVDRIQGLSRSHPVKAIGSLA